MLTNVGAPRGLIVALCTIELGTNNKLHVKLLRFILNVQNMLYEELICLKDVYASRHILSCCIWK